MKKRPSILWLVVALNLVVLVALAFAYPHLMISPGPLVKGHEELATDCFACHAAWRGASTQRCTDCHAVADVGLKTTKGVPIPSRTVKVSFHQELIEPLSDRELEILQLLSDGLTNQQIAEKLTIVLGTVKAHNHNIFGKLGVGNRVQAIARARALNLL